MLLKLYDSAHLRHAKTFIILSFFKIGFDNKTSYMLIVLQYLKSLMWVLNIFEIHLGNLLAQYP